MEIYLLNTEGESLGLGLKYLGFIYLFYFNCVNICLSVLGVVPVSGSCELLNTGAGNRTPILWKSRPDSELLNHFFRIFVFYF